MTARKCLDLNNVFHWWKASSACREGEVIFAVLHPCTAPSIVLGSLQISGWILFLPMKSRAARHGLATDRSPGVGHGGRASVTAWHQFWGKPSKTIKFPAISRADRYHFRVFPKSDGTLLAAIYFYTLFFLPPTAGAAGNSSQCRKIAALLRGSHTILNPCQQCVHFYCLVFYFRKEFVQGNSVFPCGLTFPLLLWMLKGKPIVGQGVSVQIWKQI